MTVFKKLFALLLALALTFSLAACGKSNGQSSQAGKPKTITVGASNFTEALILGNIYTQLIEANTDYQVTQKFGLAGAALCFDALERGDVDMFVEYTGTALMNLLGQPMNTDKEAVYQTVSQLMSEEHSIHTSQPLGFNNTYVMSVKPATAQEYGLATLSDLVEQASALRLGCTVEFIQREDCLPLLESQYGMKFEKVSGLDASLRYDAIEADEVEVVDAFSTDALLSKLGLVLLEDDLNFFPPYYAVNFVKQGLLEQDPALAELLAKLDGTIDEAKMAAMNAQVDIEGADAKDVAHQFLAELGLAAA